MNLRSPFLWTFLAVLVRFGNASANEVKVYLDETRTEYIVAEKLDCKVYEGKRGITIGFKAATCFFSFGPEFNLGGSRSIAWDAAVQQIIARYKELCTRFNSGAITMMEYEERLEKIDSISKEALLLQERMNDKVKKESKEAFNELDSEVGGGQKIDTVEVGRAIDSLTIKIGDLP